MIIGVSNTFDNLEILLKIIEHANVHDYLFKRNKKQIEAKYLNHLKKDNKINRDNKDINNLNINLNLKNEDSQSNFSYDYVDCMPTGNIDNENNESEFFSFENFDIDNFKLLSQKDENKEINFNFNSDKKERNKSNINNEKNNTNNAEFYNNKRKFVEDELISIIKITQNLINSKNEIFKENIRLFPPDVKLREKSKLQNIKLDCDTDLFKEYEREHAIKKNEVIERLKLYEKNMIKVDRKLDKLKSKIKENFEYIDIEDHLKLKKFLIGFEKNVDRFIKDFNQLFADEIKYIPPEKFSDLHNYIDEFNDKNEKLYNLGNSIQEVFGFINKLIN